MIKELSITIKPEDEKNNSLIKSYIFKELKKSDVIFTPENVVYVFQRKSIDARHGQIKLHLRFKVYIDEKPEETSNSLPEIAFSTSAL